MPKIRRREPVKATIVLPAQLHRWLRHRAVDEDSSLQEVVVDALTGWAQQHGYVNKGDDLDEDQPHIKN